MYIFYIHIHRNGWKPIYNNDDLGHYSNNKAALYCALLSIWLESCFMNSLRIQQAELKLSP